MHHRTVKVVYTHEHFTVGSRQGANRLLLTADLTGIICPQDAWHVLINGPAVVVVLVAVSLAGGTVVVIVKGGRTVVVVAAPPSPHLQNKCMLVLF